MKQITTLTTEELANLQAVMFAENAAPDSYEPRGLFVGETGRGFLAIDNSAGSAFTEHFRTRAEAELWLRNPDIFGIPAYREDGTARL